MPNTPRWVTRTRFFILLTAFLTLIGGPYYLSSPPAATAAATDLFFSEYIEGSSNNKALEIYNGTGAPIDLSANVYNVQMFFNGSATAGLTINLTGSVADGDVYVLAQSSASATILAQADQTNGAGWFNGDDAVVLRKGTTILDVIGQIGVDPGTEWGSGLTSTADNTIRRKSSICGGDTNGSDAFDPAVEWDGFATDTFGGLGAHVGCAGLTLSVNDVAQDELDSSTSIFTFTVSLSANAPTGGVTFDIATADGTTNPATAGSDYVAKSETGRTIAEGSNSATFTVTVNGDTSVEPNETFFVNVTNVTNATVADGQGLGTITNDDVVITPINQIQGNASTSPLVGQSVTTTGVVTGRRTNGFFLQTPDGAIDADSETSEGILVFTGGAPPAAATIGNFVRVSGTVTEFIPGADPNSQPETEITSPTVTLLSSSNPLPAPIVLSASETTDPSEITNEPLDTLEEYEGMRVSVASLTVSAPTQAAFIDENDAIGVSNGVFYGVITGVSRPFREAGINISDPVPAPNPVNVPRFDENPERIRIDSDAQPGTTTINVTTGTIVSNITGPLDYAFRTYTILPDAATPPVVGSNAVATPAPIPADGEFTVASFNTFHFYDTVNDPGVSDIALTPTAYNNRLNKISLVIRDVMRTPDVIGLQEIENLTVLQNIATKVNADAVTAGDPDPQYVAYLFEGHDIGGIDVGFLVKSARIAVVNVEQVELPGCDPDFANTCYNYIDPNTSQPALLNDRPPLILEATTQSSTGGIQPFTVIVNHLRSLNGIDDPADGNRVRHKRRAQAEFLANLIQGRQSVDPAERIIVVGDMNAFQLNDGYVDVIGTIKGTPAPPDEVVLASNDLVEPNLTNLVDSLTADQRYSFTFDGNAQVLDHILVNDPANAVLSRYVYARSNADFPATYYGDPTRPERITDHDIPVAYFDFPPVITLTTGTINLSPPNHSYRTVSISDMVASAADAGDPSITIDDVVISQVTSDESENAPGSADGNTINDIVIAGDCKSVQLRAERNNGLNGRVYTVTLKVTDAGGNVTTATRLVTVQISPGAGNAVDSGPMYTVTSACP
jgi:uncharacterized protein